jgi:hypothetical protein
MIVEIALGIVLAVVILAGLGALLGALSQGAASHDVEPLHAGQVLLGLGLLLLFFTPFWVGKYWLGDESYGSLFYGILLTSWLLVALARRGWRYLHGEKLP